MKLNFKKIFLISSILILIVFLPDINLYYQRYKLRNEKLPDKYKNQTELENLKDDYYEIIDLEGISSESIIQANDSTIVVLFNNSKDSEKGGWDYEKIWYKINLQGQITDSLKYSYSNIDEHNYKTFNSYIVDTKKNTFNHWIINNDTLSYKFKNIDENKIFSIEEAKEIIANRKFMYSERIQSDINEDEVKYKLIVYKDNVWNYLYTSKDWYERGDYIENELQAISYYPVDIEPDYAPTMNDGDINRSKQTFIDINNPKRIIYREYVHKEEWNENSFWYDIVNWHWGTGNGSNTKSWIGSSYFSIKMPIKKLHYKQPISIEYPDGYLRDKISYSVYIPKNGEYIILGSYLIRPKQKKKD